MKFWTEDGGKTLFVQLTDGVTEDTSITITTEKDKFTVSYVVNGGTPVASDEVGSGSSIDPNDKTTTRDGYSFAGWYSDAALTQKVTGAITITAHTTFYAKWSASGYTITYNLDGGVLAEGVTNPTSYNTETENFTLHNPTKEGYNFLGWTGTGLTAATQTVTVAKGSTGNRSYTATWERALANLTITATCADASQDFIFTVSGEGVNMQVVIPASDFKTDGTASVTIYNLPVDNYTVTENTDWSWRYASESPKEIDLTADTTVPFENKCDKFKWLDATAIVENKFGKKTA